MEGSQKSSQGATMFMVASLVAMMAAMGFLGWNWMNHKAQASPASQGAAPAPEAAPNDAPAPAQSAPVSGDRLIG